MKNQFWTVDGVHAGKRLSKLPITYLLWFVGSPIMRRTRWLSCQIALCEVRRRLALGVSDVEAELLAGLEPKPPMIQAAMKARRKAYLLTVRSEPKCPSTSAKVLNRKSTGSST